ncbi:MAG: TraR/DksA family transcriptional regulator [Gammaproteobacteria bacterium]|nr:TraR/DksA family transcriptional regulator [Gammaproteobacteria bacterium]
MIGDRYMQDGWPAGLRDQLLQKKDELSSRLDRIHLNVRRPLHADSKERAKELEDQEVVDALGNEAREELAKVSDALERMDAGTYGLCTECNNDIGEKRLLAYPYADECIDCATLEEERRRRL